MSWADILAEHIFVVLDINCENKFRETYIILNNREDDLSIQKNRVP